MTATVLLLHGQPGSAVDWNRVTRLLAEHAEIVVIDRPGWDGRSRAAGLAGNGAAALAALEARGAGSAVVAGHSLGAAIAAWLAVHHPERVSELILAAPAANLASLDPVDRWLAAPALGEVAAAAGMGALGLALVSDRVRRRISAMTDLDPVYLRHARRTLLTPAGWRAYAVEQRALVRDMPALDAGLGMIRSPTTILTGDHDRVVAPAAARRLADQIPDARLVVRPGGGHMLPQRDPAFVAGEILAALSRAAGSTLAGA